MNARSLILTPLLVMVLLTFLVGGTAYQQTQKWEQGVTVAANNISQLVILNNIQWGLRKIQKDLAENPAQATETWHELQREVLVLSKLQQQDGDSFDTVYPASLQLILQTPKPSPTTINVLLKGHFLSLKIGRAHV